MKAAVSKTVLGVKPLTWVRIPPSPPPGGQLGSQLGRPSQPSHEPALHVGFRRVLHGNQQPTITHSVKPGCTGLEQQRRRHRPGTAPIPACPWAGSRIPPSPPPGGQLSSQLGRPSQPSHEPALHVGFRAHITNLSTLQFCYRYRLSTRKNGSPAHLQPDLGASVRVLATRPASRTPRTSPRGCTFRSSSSNRRGA